MTMKYEEKSAKTKAARKVNTNFLIKSVKRDREITTNHSFSRLNINLKNFG